MGTIVVIKVLSSVSMTFLHRTRTDDVSVEENVVYVALLDIRDRDGK